jgi:hypothetical protein
MRFSVDIAPNFLYPKGLAFFHKTFIDEVTILFEKSKFSIKKIIPSESF